MIKDADLERLLIERACLVVPSPTMAGDGRSVTTQLDAVLMSVGFKLSAKLFHEFSHMDPGEVLDQSVRVLAIVKKMVGAHVQHNVYFARFPHGVPDTFEFWTNCIVDALTRVATEAGADLTVFGDWRYSDEAQDAVAEQLDLIFSGPAGKLNLLKLPMYGTPQHSYEELEAVHDQLIESVSDRLTVLDLAPYGSLQQAARELLYFKMASSTVPLPPEDVALFQELAFRFAQGSQPESIPSRENRAVLNKVRLTNRWPLVVDTVTDVLRLAAVCSPQTVPVQAQPGVRRMSAGWLATATSSVIVDGDVSLREVCKFRTFSRPERRVLMGALEHVIAVDPSKIADVHRYAERWKRLAGKLKPHEYEHLHWAQLVFVAARGGLPHITVESEVEEYLSNHQVAAAAHALARSPGKLYRSADHLLRLSDSDQLATVVGEMSRTTDRVSGRVLLSLREHIQNRGVKQNTRIFVNRNGRAWVTDDRRDPLPEEVRDELQAVLDSAIARRLPAWDRVLVQRDVLGVALPLSMKTMPAGGFGVMPRGSVSAPLEHDTLRYFAHWVESEKRTDYDLSGLMLDDNFHETGHVSWTSYRAGAFTYSGDITYAPAPDGATEHIDCWLSHVQHNTRYLVPQLNIYSGEAFDEAAECFMGYMERDRDQLGLPYEPRTVRFKSDVRGSGKVSLPFLIMRGDDGKWRVKWMHLYLKGSPFFNMVEGNKLTTGLQARAIVERNYLRVSYIRDLLGDRVLLDAMPEGQSTKFEKPVTWIGLDRPTDLPTGSQVISLQNLAELIPE